MTLTMFAKPWKPATSSRLSPKDTQAAHRGGPPALSVAQPGRAVLQQAEKRPLRRHLRRPTAERFLGFIDIHVDPPLAPPFVNMTQVAQWFSMYPRTNCSTANSGPLPSARQRCGPATFCAWRPAAQPQQTVVSRPDLTVLARRGGRVNGSSTYIGSGQRQHGKQRPIVECV